jgi:hypothetical protein
MPSTQRSTTPVGIDLEVMEGRYAELGDYTVAFETYKQDLDAGPYFRGLPEDRCICVHLGYLTSGQITFRYADHEETFVAGDAYVAPARHLPVIAYSRSNEPFSDARLAGALARCWAYAGEPHRARPFADEAPRPTAYWGPMILTCDDLGPFGSATRRHTCGGS